MSLVVSIERIGQSAFFQAADQGNTQCARLFPHVRFCMLATVTTIESLG